MISEKIPANILDALDQTTVIDENLQVVPTAVALRALELSELTKRNLGLKFEGFLPHPLAAQLEFSQRCNLSCVYCYNESGPRNENELSIPDLDRVCRQLREVPLVELIISGGEPLMRPAHMQAIFDVFEGSKVPIHLLTNGLLLTHDKLDWLKEHNVVSIQVSVDGADPDVHDEQRGMKGSWARAMEGLSRAHENGFETLISSTITHANVAHIPDLIDYAYLVGANVVSVGDLITWGRGKGYADTSACTDDEMDWVIDMLQQKRQAYRNHLEIRLSVNMLYYICQILIREQETILIRGNGDVLPHCTMSGLVVGNIHENSVMEIWDNTLKKLSENPAALEILNDHEITRTPVHQQLRCYRRDHDESRLSLRH